MEKKETTSIKNKRHLSDDGDAEREDVSKKPKQDPKQQKVFRYGNYNRYYGYRNANKEKDKRIDAFKEDWFNGKTCLDIGCNVGHLTLWITKYFKVKSMRGVDIDCKLIQAAKSNIQHYMDDDIDAVQAKSSDSKEKTELVVKEQFPYNITFVTVSSFL